MKKQFDQILSTEGEDFLNDPIMYAALIEICTPLGTTPKEFLVRFEKVLSSEPNRFFAIFE